MKHKIEDPISKGYKEFSIIIELIPDTDSEAIAINKAENMTSDDEIINDFLLFCLGNEYNIVNADPIGNRKFKLTAVRI